MKQDQVDLFFKDRTHQPDYRVYQNGDREMAYVAVGDATKPLVLFVHGSPGRWSNFLSFMADDALLARARIASVDRPGFGKSGPGSVEKSITRQAADIAPILRENAASPAILVGHSLGGPVIARIAMDYPDLVGGLIMVAPSIDPELEKTKWYQIPADWLIFSWMIPTDLVMANREILPLKGELEAMLPLWAHITAPTTVIQGEKDRLVPPGNADFAQKVLTRAPVDHGAGRRSSIILCPGADRT